MIKILNIQADEQVSRLMTWILAERGYEVINVRDPVDAANRPAPDVIIINTAMAQNEKRACIEALRTLVPGVSIIDLGVGSGHPNYDSGADFYLSKPFHADDLVARMGEASQAQR